jgi:predicted house-cleaning noncanonical NTP pyrophosphatase (MazG superfamily)
MKHEKLVRDFIPQIIEENGDQAITRILDNEEYLLALKDKLKEEVEEYLESEDLDELADIIEVIRALIQFHTASYDELEEIRQKKLDERGGFSAKIFLIETIENS